MAGVGAVAGVVGKGLKTVKNKWVEHQVGRRVVGAGWGAITCTFGRGLSTLADAAGGQSPEHKLIIKIVSDQRLNCAKSKNTAFTLH